MALWKFTNLNKYGNTRSRIIYRPDGEAFGFNPKGLGSFVNVQMFKYEHKHEITPPSLVVLNDKKYIVPTWKEVDPNTTLNDIQWIKPKSKVKRSKTVVKTFNSGSSDATYTTKFYPDSGKYFCDCPGSWRSFGNCKHIKQMRNEK
tara:strand:+ start:326 stop:763 length:438 start_codon:yes stop_codon:yes gene_type:complete